MTLLDLLADACESAAYAVATGYVVAPDRHWTYAEREYWRGKYELAVAAWTTAAAGKHQRGTVLAQPTGAEGIAS